MEGEILMSKANGSICAQATSVHFLLQGKGGVGKSLVASILSQYFVSKGATVHAVDADPVNHTLAEYRGLDVDALNLLKNGNVDQRQFDTLLERFLTEAGTFVVDTGAATFIPLWNYVLENNALDFLMKRGRRIFVHTVITGGQALSDTLTGFDQLAQTTVERNLVVWLNEFFGDVKRESATFVEMDIYKTNREKIHGVIAIARRNADTFGKDVEDMISRKLTFDEAVSGGDLTIMAKQRLRVVQRDLFGQLDAIALC
jgi:hypothetical protein